MNVEEYERKKFLITGEGGTIIYEIEVINDDNTRENTL